MAAQVETATRTFTAGGAISQYARVKFDGTSVTAAGASDDWIGVAQQAAFASGDVVAVRLRTSEGTCKMIASAAISAGAEVQGAAAGKIATSAGTGSACGTALEAATDDGDVIEVLGNVIGSVARADITQQDLAVYPVALELFRVHDALQTALPTTAANDDLGLTAGTFGTSAPVLNSVDFGGTSTTAYGRVRVPVPVEYVAGQTVTLRVNAGMLTTVSDGTATVDASVYRDAAPTVDICATAAQSANSLTAADLDFTLTPTNVVPGDILDIRLAVAGSDSGDAGEMKVQINSVELLLDVKG